MPNKIKTSVDKPILFIASEANVPSGLPAYQDYDRVAFEISDLDKDKAKVSATYDLGVGPRPSLFEWRGRVALDIEDTPTGIPPDVATIDAYIVSSDGYSEDGDVHQGDKTASLELPTNRKVKNLQYVGAIQIDQPLPETEPLSTTFQNSGLLEVFGRYISIVWWNNAKKIKTDLEKNLFTLTPVPEALQSPPVSL